MSRIVELVENDDENPQYLLYDTTRDKNYSEKSSTAPLKVFVVGSRVGGSHYIDWLDGPTRIVSSIEECDVLCFTGGEDINPALYNDPNVLLLGRHVTYGHGYSRDIEEIRAFEKGMKLNKSFFGICRGGQLLTAFAGGKLFQDVSHPNSHDLILNPSLKLGVEKINSNSIHHQAFDLRPLKEGIDFELLAWARGLSSIYIDRTFDGINSKDKALAANNKVIKSLQKKFKAYTSEYIVEPEVVWFPKIRGFAIQGHPEMMQGTRLQEFRSTLGKIAYQKFTTKLISDATNQ